jgi:hypothetical protein
MHIQLLTMVDGNAHPALLILGTHLFVTFFSTSGTCNVHAEQLIDILRERSDQCRPNHGLVRLYGLAEIRGPVPEPAWNIRSDSRCDLLFSIPLLHTHVLHVRVITDQEI